MLRTLSLVLLLSIISVFSYAQGTLTGDLQLNYNVFQRDSSIGAFNTPQYDNYFTGGEAWLNLNYNYKGFVADVRFDLFNNSNLKNPNGSYTGVGIGLYSLSKKIGDLTVTGGYFYEQFGSGIVYRSYEDRGLGIDYATFGIDLHYDLGKDWTIKAFTGQEKNLFSTFKSIIKGLNIEGVANISDDVRLLPGAAVMNRTMDETSINLLVSTINTYDSTDQFVPKYNVYAMSGYYTLNVKDFSWYVEGDYKTHEAIYDISNKLIDKPGSVVYSSLSYSRKGFGITAQAKRTENFVLRTSPNELLLDGVMNFVPPMSRQNSLRLPARYTPATQYLGEFGFQGDVVYTPKRGCTISVNYSDIKDLNQHQLWREVYGDVDVTKKKIQYMLGAQYVFYNQTVYRAEPLSDLTAIAPFAEFTYKFTHKKSLRTEVQYQSTEEDYGSMLFALLEFNIAPTWSFAVSDMYNIDPNPAKTMDKNHYYNFFVAFTKSANRFSLAYVKQIAGVNCTGGVCRYEPAFSGLKFLLTSSF